MRIALLTTSFPRDAEDPSGHFVAASARRLFARGHEVHVIAPGGSPLAPPEPAFGVLVHRAGGGSLFSWPGAIARAREAPLRLLALAPFAAAVRLRLRALRAAGALDALVAHWIVPSAFPLLLDAPAPLEVVAHGADVRLLLAMPEPTRDRIFGVLLARGARFTFAARALLDALQGALSPSLAEALGRASRVEPPPLDLPSDLSAEATALRTKLALLPGEQLFISAGRLIPSKRVELAIDAVAAARSLGGLPARLAVVGDGPDRAALTRRARDLSVNVIFTGALPRREALAWIAAADALVHPSGCEAAPTVVREARALGVPVAACDAGDIISWAREDEGLHVAAPSGLAIAAALRAIAEAPRATRPLTTSRREMTATSEARGSLARSACIW
jgi:teichuronic acid biosynthesis glycosyltransferase TuaC